MADRYVIVVNPSHRRSGWDAGVRVNGDSIPNGSGWHEFITRRGAMRWGRRWIRRQERLARRERVEVEVIP